MTIDEAINILKQYIDYDNPNAPDFYTMAEAIEVVIKALEQEPIEPILDKIRAEIEHHRRKTKDIDPYDLVGDCLDIIDKYKAESEDKE